MPDPLAAAERDAKVAARVRQIRFPWEWRRLDREGFFTDLGPISTAALIDCFQKIDKNRRLLELLVQILLVIPICLFFLRYSKIHPAVVGAVWMPLGIAIMSITPYLAGTRQRNIARILAGAKSNRALPILIAGLKASDKRTRYILHSAIAQFLLDADEEMFNTLQIEDRKALYGSMHTGLDGYKMTVIDFASRFQDVSALNDVKQVRSDGATPIGQNRALRQAAKQCIEQLQYKRDNLLQNDKLLRPVAPPANEELLRPIGNNGTSDHLLHPAESDNNEVINTTGNHT